MENEGAADINPVTHLAPGEEGEMGFAAQSGQAAPAASAPGAVRFSGVAAPAGRRGTGKGARALRVVAWVVVAVILVAIGYTVWRARRDMSEGFFTFSGDDARHALAVAREHFAGATSDVAHAYAPKYAAPAFVRNPGHTGTQVTGNIAGSMLV